MHKKYRFIDLKSNLGRTMTEMLGILAIIGVLSLAALTGYRTAMNSHKANVLLEDVRLMSTTILQTSDVWEEDRATGRIEERGAVINTSEFIQTTPYPMNAILENTSTQGFSIQVENVEEGVCSSVLNKADSQYEIRVNGIFDGNCKKEGNTLNIVFLGETDGETDRPDDCKNTWCAGVCCDEGKICVNNMCVEPDACDFDSENPCGTGCCSKDNSCCGGTCCRRLVPCTGENNDVCCYGEVSGNGKVCCNDGEIPYEKICCGTDANNLQLVEHIDRNNIATCTCPDGYQMIEGVCFQTLCYTAGSTTDRCTDSNCDCYLNGLRCGTQCSADGLSCMYGFCTNPPCPEGTTFAYNSGKAYYGCLTKNAPSGISYNCTNTSRSVRCYNDGSATTCGGPCTLQGKNCSIGRCYENNCLKGWEPAYGHGGYGCKKKEDGTFCAGLVEPNYSCTNADGKLCATICRQNTTTNTYDCQIDYCSSCPEGATQVTNTGGRILGCKKNELVCYVTSSNGITDCYWDGLFCGHRCDFSDGTCGHGDCSSGTCPGGLTFQKTPYYGLYGCGNETVTCVKSGSSYFCYTADGECGRGRANSYLDAVNTLCPTVTCPNGGNSICTPDINGGNVCGCSYGSELFCTYRGTCYLSGLICGNGCEIDGHNCNSGVCRAEDCPEGYEPVLYNNNSTTLSTIFTCKEISEVSCTEDGTCSFGNKPCGTGCLEDGTMCTTGTCSSDECSEETTLSRVNNLYYGCYSAENDTKCYRSGYAYICYKNGVICGNGCNVDGTGCTSEGQTCVTEE